MYQTITIMVKNPPSSSRTTVFCVSVSSTGASGGAAR